MARIDFVMRSDTAQIVGLDAIVLACVESKGSGRSWHNSAKHERVMVKVLTADPKKRLAMALDNAKFFGWTPPSWTDATGVCTVVYPEQLRMQGPGYRPVGQRFTVDGWQMWRASARLPYWHHAAMGKGSWSMPDGWSQALVALTSPGANDEPKSPAETYPLESARERRSKRKRD